MSADAGDVNHVLRSLGWELRPLVGHDAYELRRLPLRRREKLITDPRTRRMLWALLWASVLVFLSTFIPGL